MYEVGDMVLVLRGQTTKFFEVIQVEEGKDFIWISNGHVQITRKVHEVELICKASDRKDEKVPVIRYFK